MGVVMGNVMRVGVMHFRLVCLHREIEVISVEAFFTLHVYLLSMILLQTNSNENIYVK